jgi:hypothetical protein
MNLGLVVSGAAGAGVTIGAVATGTGVSSATGSAVVVVTTGAIAPGVPGGLMMIWTHPPRRIREQRRIREHNPAIFMSIHNLSFTVFHSWLFSYNPRDATGYKG